LAVKGQWRLGRRQGRAPSGGRPALEGLEARRLLTSSISGTNVYALAGKDATLDVANYQYDSTLDFASATIDWGDGSAVSQWVVDHVGPAPVATTNTVASTAGGKGNITGDHTYTQPGTYTITVTAQESGSIGDGKSATVTSTATVADASINPGPVLSLQEVKGVAFNNVTVATFTTPVPGASASDFKATIDWGDKTDPTAGVVVALPRPYSYPLPPAGASTDPSGNGSTSLPIKWPPPQPFPTSFAVTGGHTYTTSGPFTATITISNGSGHSVTTTANVTVADSALVAQPISDPFQAIAGENYDAIPVAGFTDLSASPSSNGQDPTANYTATIDWGDNTATTPGQIDPAYTYDSSGAKLDHPSFQVSGSHTYADPGTFTITVTISDQAGDSVTATRAANVASLSLTAKGQDVSALTGDGTTPLYVASFDTVPPDASVSPSDFSATIDWGDGSKPSDGQIVGGILNYPIMPDGSTAATPSFLPGGYQVVGQHDYAAPGSFPITVTISGPGGATATAMSTATVAAIRANGVSFDATTNQADTGQQVATFQVGDPNATASDFTATIDWGDNSTPTDGTITPEPSPLEVAGSSDNSGSSSTSAIAIKLPPGGNPLPIPWPFPNGFSVTGDHTYTADGSYTVKVTITDQNKNSVTTTATATVSNGVIRAQGLDFDATTNQADTGQTVAEFTATDPNASASDFKASIRWGDGGMSDGTINPEPIPLGVAGASGGTSTATPGSGTQPAVIIGKDPIPWPYFDRFSVSGDHTYKQAGTYTVTVTITDTNGDTATTTSTATVSDDSITAFPLPVTLQAADANTSVIVAGFTDAAGLTTDQFTASIDWGDNSTSDGTIKPGPVLDPPVPIPVGVSTTAAASSSSTLSSSDNGSPTRPIFWGPTFIVVGQHGYAAPGKYTIQVTIKSTLGAEADVTTIAVVTGTPTPSPPPTPTPPATGSSTLVSTPAPTPTPTPTQDPSPTPAPTPSPSPTPSPGPTPSPSPTPTPTSTPGQGDPVSPSRPVVIVGASHPGKGARKHHPWHKPPVVPARPAIASAHHHGKHG
jgi:PKD repeat protein